MAKRPLGTLVSLAGAHSRLEEDTPRKVQPPRSHTALEMNEEDGACVVEFMCDKMPQMNAPKLLHAFQKKYTPNGKRSPQRFRSPTARSSVSSALGSARCSRPALQPAPTDNGQKSSGGACPTQLSHDFKSIKQRLATERKSVRVGESSSGITIAKPAIVGATKRKWFGERALGGIEDDPPVQDEVLENEKMMFKPADESCSMLSSVSRVEEDPAVSVNSIPSFLRETRDHSEVRKRRSRLDRNNEKLSSEN